MQQERGKKEQEINKTARKQYNGISNSLHINLIQNVNGLNSPMKRHAMDEWIKKQDPEICCLQQTHFNFMEIH